MNSVPPIGNGWQLLRPETLDDRMQLTLADGSQWTNPEAHREQAAARWLVLRSIHAGALSHDDEGQAA